VPSLAAGDRVSHDSFGLGTVLRVEGEGERALAHVDFGVRRVGVKRLLLRYAPVEKLLSAETPSSWAAAFFAASRLAAAISLRFLSRATR
jgi:hypothetical protein